MPVINITSLGLNLGVFIQVKLCFSSSSIGSIFLDSEVFDLQNEELKRGNSNSVIFLMEH